MMLGSFLIFLTFLARKLCLPAVGSAPWQGLKISSCLRRGPVRRQAFGPDGDGLGDFRLTVLYTETEVTRSTSRRLPNRREHELIDFEHGGIRCTAGIGPVQRWHARGNLSEHRKARDGRCRGGVAAIAARVLRRHLASCPDGGRLCFGATGAV